jgi:hypothetical protein
MINSSSFKKLNITVIQKIENTELKTKRELQIPKQKNGCGVENIFRTRGSFLRSYDSSSVYLLSVILLFGRLSRRMDAVLFAKRTGCPEPMEGVLPKSKITDNR